MHLGLGFPLGQERTFSLIDDTELLTSHCFFFTIGAIIAVVVWVPLSSMVSSDEVCVPASITVL